MEQKVEKTSRVENGVLVERTIEFSPATHTRSGACPYCLRNHLLKARGYAKEVREDPSREWEAEMLLQNLLLAEDHAEAMGDWNLRSAIRAERLRAENGEFVDAESLLARAREKILESQQGAGVEAKAEPARTEEH